MELEKRLNITASSESEDQDQEWKALEYDSVDSCSAISDVDENIVVGCDGSEENDMNGSELHSTVIPNGQIEEATICNGYEAETMNRDEDSESDICDFDPEFLKNPGKWIEHGPLDQTEFDALVTYVDHSCAIYLHKKSSQYFRIIFLLFFVYFVKLQKDRFHLFILFLDHDLLEYIKNTLQKRYQNCRIKPYDKEWEVGEICIAEYHHDKMWYRGEVQRVLNKNSVMVNKNQKKTNNL